VNSGQQAVAGVALASGRMVVAVHGDELLLQEHVVPPSDEHQIVEQLTELLQSLEKHVGRFGGIGLSIGGHISQDGRKVTFAPGLVEPGRDWKDVPIVELLENATELGVARGLDDFCVVYLAPDVQGLGCGIVAGGQLVRGTTGGAGEFGHIVIQPEGPLCRCGNRGCLEAMLAVENFDRDMNWGGVTRSVGFAAAAELLSGPDPDRAQRVFRRSGKYLGQGLATTVNLLNPKMIILGGPAELVGPSDGPDKASSDFFMDGLRDAMTTNAFSSMARDCHVVVDQLDLKMAAMGAAILLQRATVDGRAPEQVA
jgi:predicted NBD/HSP70 family sugar kinase